MPTLSMQLATAAVDITCAEPRFFTAFARYIGNARHEVPAETRIAVEIGSGDGGYRLPSGRRELSSEMAAEHAWNEISAKIEAALLSFVQIGGLCLEGHGRRLLVLVEDPVLLGPLGMHCLAHGLDLSSPVGVCLRAGTAIPYALPIEVDAASLRRFRHATGLDPATAAYRRETGQLRCQLTPASFGRTWTVSQAPVDLIVVLKWNPGGYSARGRRNAATVTDHLLAAIHMPRQADVATKLRLVGEGRRFAAATPAVDLHLGALADAPLQFEALLAQFPGNQV